MDKPVCMICGAPARERDCGGYDDFCADDCEIQGGLNLLARLAAEKKKREAAECRDGAPRNN